MEYNVWVTRYGSSARNAGIVGSRQHTRSSWGPDGSLQWIPINDGTQENFRFEARDDSSAFAELTRRFNLAHPENKRPLSGKSYMRTCRGTK